MLYVVIKIIYKIFTDMIQIKHFAQTVVMSFEDYTGIILFMCRGDNYMCKQ